MSKIYALLCAITAFSILSHAQTPVVNAKKRTGTLTIDGNPNESSWEFTNNITKTIIGSPNNTSKFAVQWDEQYLYVAVTVVDAAKRNDSSNPWEDDAVELFIDADNNGGTSYGNNDRQFMKEWNSSSLYEKNNRTSNVSHGWVNTSNGYAVEFRVPWSSIGISNPSAGFTIGFDVAVDDDDNGGNRESQHMWAGDNDNWQYPRNFGDLVLVSGDAEAPSAPSNLSASSVTQSSLILNWTASTDNVGVAGYDIYRNGTKINGSIVTGTTYNVTGLNAATAYQFYVRALDDAGNVSGNSNTINVTTPDTQAPSVPGNLQAGNITHNSAVLTWNASNDNVGVIGYDIYQGPNMTKLNTNPVTGTSYNLSALSASTGYTFYVTASDAAGNVSSNASVSFTTVAPPDTEAPTAPGNLDATNITQQSVTLTWSASTDNSGSVYYDIFRNGAKINSNPVTVTSFQVTGLSASTNYSFYVQAKDAAGNASANSNTLNVTTPDTQAPTAPGNLSATGITQTSFTLNWSASSDNVGVTGYKVYQDNVKLNAALITATSYAIGGLTANTTYNYHVEAVDAAGNQTSSAALSVTTLLPPDIQAPTAPQDLAASSLTQSGVTLTWTASSDDRGVAGYDVFRNGVRINTSLITSTSYQVTGLAAVTSYEFYVLAKDLAGNVSESSNTVTVVTPDTQAPTAPTGLTSSNVTAAGLRLTWNASTDNVGVTGYFIYQDGSQVNATAITGTLYDVTGLTQATNYSFYVRAVDNAGNVSGNSTAINVTTSDAQAPSAPTALAVSNLAATSLTLGWNASTDNVGVTGYDVYRNGTKINASPVTATSYNVTGLTASTAYSFYVQARDAAGNISANSNVVNATTTAGGCTGTGTIRFQRWNNISGTSVSNLTSNANYPNNPSTSGTLTSFETPSQSGDNFGMKVFGYLCPPATGSYTFWIASDDNSELWLSTTSSPANKVRIAYHTQYTGSREWNKYATQKSAAITLTAGNVYYIEALMKDGTQNDNLAVGWARPGQSTNAPSEVIPGSRLMPTLADTEAPTAPLNLAAGSITQSSLTLTWSASTDDVGVTGYDVYQNNVKINASNISSTSYNVTGLSSSTIYTFYVVAKDAAGNSAASNAINVSTGAPDTQAPTAPLNLSSNNITQTSATINWSAATDNVGVSGYDVYRNGTKVNTNLVTTTSYNVTGLTAATTYSFTVIAKDAAGNSSVPSAALSVTTLLPNPGSELFTQRTVIANQRMPHDLVYGPDNNIWYTERFGGTVSYVNPATGAKTVVLTLGSQMARTGGQDGLMGLALHPEFMTGKPYVYISYTYQSTSATMRKMRIARYTYNFNTRTLGNAVTILQDIPGSNDHNSARLAIGPDNKLYFSVGDMGAGQYDNMNRANNVQNLNILEGKILRLNTELEGNSWIPADNPFSSGGQKTSVYTFGHRNPQGLVWGKVNGVDILYSSEHGPYSDDEINIIESGRNYGWPQVAGFCDGNYNGRTIGGFNVVSEQNNCATLNAMEPIRSLFPAANPPSGGDNMYWPSTGVSGTDFYGSDAIPGWQNSLLVANLKNGTVSRFKLSNNGQSIISDTIHYFRGKGRFRDVIVSPDGLKIYVACDSSGSTSGPTGGVTTTPPNPGAILEFTFQQPVTNQLWAGSRTAAIEVEEMKDKSTDIYPNPANNFIMVYSYSGDAGRQVELVDLNGRTLKRQPVTGLTTRVDLSNVGNGLYVLKISDAKGKIVRTEKIIVQK